MKKNENKIALIFILLMIIGIGLLLYSTIKMYNYPQFNELRKAAFISVKTSYWTGISILLLGYILTYIKKK